MKQKFLISKKCLESFNRDTIEILMFISEKYPLENNFKIKSENGKVIIYTSEVKIILPSYKLNTTGSINFTIEDNITYISFFEDKR